MSFLDLFKKKVMVVTHNGSFHADEVFAVASLSIWAQQEGVVLKVVRTRDPAIIAKADIVVDVGMAYIPEKNRFDHHQRGGAGTHPNTIPYASFGLVWKHYGEKICPREVAEMIEEQMVIPIDARDNGINISQPIDLGVMDYIFNSALHNFNPTLSEGEEDLDSYFKKALDIVVQVLRREILWKTEIAEGTRLTKEAIKMQGEPEILVLEDRIESTEEVTKHKNIKFIASKSKVDDNWSVISARDNLEDYNSNRVLFPESWRGLRDEELSSVAGVEGAIFCHRGGWFIKAKTREAALAMAKAALNKSSN